MEDLPSQSYGENIKTDRLIVMEDVSCLAEKSNEFASFLKVSRKFQYSCVYIFHIIFLEKTMWKLTLLQTNIFNIFPGSMQQCSVMKIFQANCVRESLVIYLKTLFG